MSFVFQGYGSVTPSALGVRKTFGITILAIALVLQLILLTKKHPFSGYVVIISSALIFYFHINVLNLLIIFFLFLPFEWIYALTLTPNIILGAINLMISLRLFTINFSIKSMQRPKLSWIIVMAICALSLCGIIAISGFVQNEMNIHSEQGPISSTAITNDLTLNQLENTSYKNGDTLVKLSNGSGTFPWEGGTATMTLELEGTSIGDLNGDGTSDAVVRLRFNGKSPSVSESYTSTQVGINKRGHIEFTAVASPFLTSEDALDTKEKLTSTAIYVQKIYYTFASGKIDIFTAKDGFLQPVVNNPVF